MRYSATTKGFYAYDIDYASVPDDCVEVSAEDYAALMNGQADGNIIVPAMQQAAKELGVKLTWGGSWKTFPDGPHFQIDRS